MTIKFTYTKLFFILLAATIVAAHLKVKYDMTHLPAEKTPHFRADNTYFFHMGFPKGTHLGAVRGSNCDDLTGDFEWHAKRRHKGYGDLLRWMRDMRQVSEGEIDSIEEWKSQKHTFSKKLACIPYVKDITRFLKNPHAEVQDGVIALENGPILFTRGQEESEKAQTVSSITSVETVSSCGGKNHQLCTTVLMSDDKQRKYRIACWKCAQIGSSPAALKAAIKDAFSIGAINYQSEFTLEGGHMVSEDSFNKSEVWWHVEHPLAPPLKSGYMVEKYAGERADVKWNLILDLIEKEAAK